MRTSGKGSDLTVLLVPLFVLVFVGLGFMGDPGKFLHRTEQQLWRIVQSVGAWVSSLL